jgi:hypothetical protein
MKKVSINTEHFDTPSIKIGRTHYFPYPGDVKVVGDKLIINIAQYQGKWRCDICYLTELETIKAIFDKAISGELISEYPAVVKELVKRLSA